MKDKDKMDNYSQYDCELAYTDYGKQESSYLDVEHYSSFVSDEDMTIPKGFNPYSVSVNLQDDNMLESYFKEYDFKPLNDYVDKLEKEIVDVVLDSGCHEESFIVFKCNLKSNIDLDILITRYDNISTNITFCFLKDGNRFEMVEFFLYDFKLAACKERHTPDGTNRSILHDYRMEDGDNLTVYSSVFDYTDNDYILGLESVRKLSYQEFHKKLDDGVLFNMLRPLWQIDINNVPTTFEHDEDILKEPTINNFSIDGISYESNFLKKLNELLQDTSLRDMYEEKKNNSSPVTVEETNRFIDTHETRDVSPREHYKSLKKSKSSIRKDLK